MERKILLNCEGSYGDEWYRLMSPIYLSVVGLVVLFGALSCGIGIYWEIYATISYAPHFGLSALFVLGVAIGSCIAGFGIIFHGRRPFVIWPIIICIPVYVFNALYQSNHWYDIPCRAFAGIYTGCFLTASVVYLGELAHALNRSRMITALGLGLWLGTWSYVLLYKLHPLLSLLQIIFPIAYLILACIFLPESPYYIIQIKEDSSAAEVLHFLRCGPKRLKEQELKSISRYVRKTNPSQRMLYRLWTVGLLLMLTNLTGFFCMVSQVRFYHFIESDVLNIAILRATLYDILILVGIFIGGMFGFIICTTSVGRVSRRGLLIISTIGTLVCMIGICLLMMISIEPLLKTTIIFFLIPLFFFFYFLAQPIITLLIISEIFPYNYRPAGSGYGITTYFMAMMIANAITREFNLNCGHLFTIFYICATSILAICLCIWIVPAYKQMSLEATDRYIDKEGIEGKNL